MMHNLKGKAQNRLFQIYYEISIRDKHYDMSFARITYSFNEVNER